MSKKDLQIKKNENPSLGIHSSNHWANCPVSGKWKETKKRKAEQGKVRLSSILSTKCPLDRSHIVSDSFSLGIMSAFRDS